MNDVALNELREVARREDHWTVSCGDLQRLIARLDRAESERDTAESITQICGCGFRQPGWEHGRCKTCGHKVTPEMWNASYANEVRPQLERERDEARAAIPLARCESAAAALLHGCLIALNWGAETVAEELLQAACDYDARTVVTELDAMGGDNADRLKRMLAGMGHSGG